MTLLLLARLSAITVDQILIYEGEPPKEVTVKDKKGFEQLNMINPLDEEDKTTVFKIIDTMLTKKKFKDLPPLLKISSWLIPSLNDPS